MGVVKGSRFYVILAIVVEVTRGFDEKTLIIDKINSKVYYDIKLGWW